MAITVYLDFSFSLCFLFFFHCLQPIRHDELSGELRIFGQTAASISFILGFWILGEGYWLHITFGNERLDI